MSAKVTYSTANVAHLSILGEKREDRRVLLPKDDGLVSNFIDWRNGEEIIPVLTMVTGPGIHEAIYSPGDIDRITAWLERHGAKEDETE